MNTKKCCCRNYNIIKSNFSCQSLFRKKEQSNRYYPTEVPYGNDWYTTYSVY